MRILMIYSTGFPPEEGLGNYVHNLARQLIDQGHRVELITRGGRRFQTERSGPITVHRCPFVPIYPFHVHFQRPILQALVEELETDFDVIHLHSPLPPPVRSSLPIVTTFHTPMLQDQRAVTIETPLSLLMKLQSYVSATIEKSLIRNSDLITAVSGSMALQLVDYGVRLESIRITPNGVDTSYFRPLGNEKNPGQVLYTGRLGPRKGLPDLLRAIALISKKRSDFEVVITGKGDYERLLKSMASRLGLETEVSFVGHVSQAELLELYQSSEIFVFPTIYEGLPTSVLEAMACGLPVVSTFAPGVTDLISHGENGLLSKPHDYHTLAEHLEKLLSSEKLRSAYGMRNRRLASEIYDWRAVSRVMTEAYEYVLGRVS